MANKHWRLKGARAEAGLTQEAVAAYLGISTPTYCKRENNKIPFIQPEVNKLILLFGKTYEELFPLRKEGKDENKIRQHGYQEL